MPEIAISDLLDEKQIKEIESNNLIESSDDAESEELTEIFDDELLDAESVSVDKDKKFNPKSIEVGDFVNKQLVPVKKMKCIVPTELLECIQKIEVGVNRKFGSSNEFSIFIHGDYDNDGNLLVSEDFYIPKQTVTGASVDYLEEPDDFYNGCLHKHPNNCTSFSSVDEKYINSNFDFSLLYVNGKISKGVINIPYDGKHRIQCELNVCVGKEELVCDIDIDNISRPLPKKIVLPTTPPVIAPSPWVNNNAPDEPNRQIILPHVAAQNPDDFDYYQNEQLQFPFDI